MNMAESLGIKGTILSRKHILLLSLTIFLILISSFSVINRSEWLEPYIGLGFSTDSSGFVYLHPAPDGPAFSSGVKENDSLLQIESLCYYSDGSAKKTSWMLNNRHQIATSLLYKGRLIETWIEQIDDVTELGKIAYDYSNNMVIKLLIHRETKPPMDITFPVEMRRPARQFEYFFFTFIGVLTLVLGLIVFFAKKPGFEGRTLFFLFSLDAFVLLSYSYTKADDPFSQLIFFFDTVARIFFAPLFLHFIVKVAGFNKYKKLLRYLIYSVPVLFVISEILINYYDKIVSGSSDYIPKLNREYIKLQNLELFSFAFYLIASVILALIIYKKTPSIIQKKQMKLIMIGIIAGLFPLILVYLPMYLNGENIPSVVTIATGLPVLLVPISLSYAVIRHKLMDIEIQVLRSLTYAIALTFIVSIYITLVLLSIVLFPDVETESLILFLAFFTLAIAMLFEPLHKHLKKFIDKTIYRENYDFRLTLNRFSVELGSEHNLRELLYSLVSRLFLTFTISRACAFVYNKKRKVFEMYLSYPEITDHHLDRKKIRSFKIRKEFSKILSDYILLRKKEESVISYEEMKEIKEEFVEDSDIIEKYSCDYLVPLSFSGGIPALISLSRKTNGDLLTTEDLELLDIIRMPAAIACDNANLIETIAKQSNENKELSDFNTSILESMRGAVIVIDQALKVQQVNNTFNRFFDIPAEQIPGKSLSQILPRNLGEKIIPHIEPSFFEGDKSYNFYKLPHSIDGKKVFFNIAISPLLKDGFPSGYVIIIEDVSKSVFIEDQFIQTEKLASLGMMAAGMAHEVNTPLAGISSYVQMLLKQTQQTDQSFETLKKIEAQSQRIQNLVNRLLNFSRPQEVKYSETDVNSIIKETYDLFGKQLTKSGTELNLNLCKRPLIIYGDPGRIQQVLINLIINAKDSIRDSGKIIIKSQKDTDSAVITIEDNGQGISEENLRRIYDPFFTTKKDSGGTGLGLSISYAIIRDHLGTISVKSRINRGTVFTLRLPLSGSRGNDKR